MVTIGRYVGGGWVDTGLDGSRFEECGCRVSRFVVVVLLIIKGIVVIVFRRFPSLLHLQ